MTAPNSAAASLAALPLPSVVTRYAKLVWTAAGAVLAIGLAIMNYATGTPLMTTRGLVLVQAVVGILTMAGVGSTANAFNPMAVLALVTKYLPHHTLVPNAYLTQAPAPVAAVLPAPAPEPAPAPAPAVAPPAPVQALPEAVPAPVGSAAAVVQPTV